MLSLICGIARPRDGTVEIVGKNLGKMTNSERDSFRADNLGIIFQQFNLLPYLSAIDNVLLPLKFSYARKAACDKVNATPRAEAERLLKNLDISPETLGNQKAVTLSIGQQQRVAAARAFIGSPEIIIADEPTSSLDEENQTEFLKQLFSEKDATSTSLLLVSHNSRIAKRFDRLVKLLQRLCQPQEPVKRLCGGSTRPYRDGFAPLAGAHHAPQALWRADHAQKWARGFSLVRGRSPAAQSW